MKLLHTLLGKLALIGSCLALAAVNPAMAQSPSDPQIGGNVTGYKAGSQADFDAAAQWIKNKGHKQIRVHFDHNAPSARKDWARKAASDKGLTLIATTGYVIPSGGGSPVRTAGQSDAKLLAGAVNFWKSSAYSSWLKSNPGVILNIANEWGQQGYVARTSWRDEYTKAIKAIREAGITNKIIIDADGYGQSPESIATYGKGLRDLRWTANGKSYSAGTIIYSVHMYNAYFQYAYVNANNLRYSDKYHVATTIKRLRDATGAEIAVGEFGANFGLWFDITDLRRDLGAQGVNIICSWYNNY